MTLRKAVKAFMQDHPETVEGALKGDSLAVDSLARNVLRYMQAPPTSGNMDKAERRVYNYLRSIEEGERPLRGDWESKTVEDLEFYIKHCKEELEDGAYGNWSDVLVTQWDKAEKEWLLKGGNLIHDSILPPGDNSE